MSRKLLRVRVTLKGRPVRSFAFNQDRVTIGRDPGSDIFLDNAGISREHAAIEYTPSGTYILKDVGSANGIFVNDQPVKIHYIRENDVALIGKFSLWFVYDEDRRGEVSDARRLASTQDEGTTVLRASELQEMIEVARTRRRRRRRSSRDGGRTSVATPAVARARDDVPAVPRRGTCSCSGSSSPSPPGSSPAGGSAGSRGATRSVRSRGRASLDTPLGLVDVRPCAELVSPGEVPRRPTSPGRRPASCAPPAR